MLLMTRLFALTLPVTLAIACPRTEAPPPPATTTAAPASQPAGPAPIAPRIEGPVGDLLEAYEETRAKLAGDDFEGAKAGAAKINAAATSASEHAVTAKQTFLDVVAGAGRMTNAKDIKEARVAFGDVSKNVITLMVNDAELRTGRFLFMCPMVPPPGYQKWVQTTSKLHNPYWGSAMLECGEELKTWGA